MFSTVSGFDVLGWSDLAQRVNAWSMANFGDQQGLGALAPLLGLPEEAGELAMAPNEYEIADAHGDTCIFLADYAARSGVDWNMVGDAKATTFGVDGSFSTPVEMAARLSTCVGQLCHVQLKRIQKIRGYAVYEFYRVKQAKAIRDLIAAVDYHLYPYTALSVANQVYADVVSKRAWHTSPQKPITFDSAVEGYKGMVGELIWGVA